jgi:hypothetical protein
VTIAQPPAHQTGRTAWVGRRDRGLAGLLVEAVVHVRNIGHVLLLAEPLAQLVVLALQLVVLALEPPAIASHEHVPPLKK